MTLDDTLMMQDVSAMQAGLLVESLGAGRGSINLEQIVVEAFVPGLTAEALTHALAQVAGRHDCLRLQFRQEAGRYRQAVVPEAEVRLDWIAAEPLTGQDREKGLQVFLAEDRARGFSIADGPLWRATWLAADTGPSTLVWTLHHALTDGPGMAVLLADLFDVLDGQDLPEDAPSLIGLVPQLGPADPAAAKAAFAERIDPTVGASFFPASERRESGIHARVATLDLETSDQLRGLARACGATPLNLFQAIWALVLARWTGEDSARMGLVESQRKRDLQGCAGCLVTTIPFQVRFHATDRLADVLARLRADTLALRPHLGAALHDLRRWCGATATDPLFEAILMYSRRSLQGQMRDLGRGWESRKVRLFEQGSAPATLAVYDDPEIEIVLEHDAGRLPASVAAQVLGHVVALARSIARAEPATALSNLDMLSTAEIARLDRLGRSDTPLAPGIPCIATRFEATAAAHPDDFAVIDAGTGHALTYAELDQSANALAQRLAEAGLAQGEPVALQLPRSPEFVAAFLGILKAGGAALPIDPGHPLQAAQDMLVRAGVRCIVARADAALAEGCALHLVPDEGRATAPPPRPGPDPDRMAYVIHTSGSTGTPKGVMGSCGALAAHADAVTALYDLTPGDRVLQFAGLGFDVALEEMIPTLLAGARLILRDDQSAGSVQAFLDMIRRQRVTVLNLPASFWHMLVDELGPGVRALPPSVRLMITGSERISPRALARWRKDYPAMRWMNGYGPTEATITATAFDLPAGAELPEGEIPIGRPLAHASVLLRAFDGSLTPDRGEGMLWLGGPAVTLGYLRQPALTEAAFVQTPSGRLYCTGDVARWRDDGQLAYLGRRDRQVKLRGHRIDLGHIEARLAALTVVHQAHVVLDRPGTPQARLLAWVLCDTGPEDTDVEAIRQALSRVLPAHMIPTLVVVDRFPVTVNGKIDSRALPRPSVETRKGGTGTTDELTLTIAAAMAETLGLPEVAPDAVYQDLGGDSLLALRLGSLIAERTGHVVNAADLARHPTPQALAERLRKGTERPRWIVPIQPEGDRPTLFAVHVLGRNEELFRPLAAAMGPSWPMFGLTVGLPQDLSEIDVRRTARLYFEDIQAHHPEGPIGLVAVSMAAYFAYELALLLRAAGRSVRVLGILDAMGPAGRPALQGRAKLAAHLRRLRESPLHHIGTVIGNRIVQLKVAQEGRATQPGEVNGYNLVEANIRAVEGYDPPPYDGRLTIFRADESFWDSPESLATGLGWSGVARGGFDLIDVPGNHLSILYPENVAVLAMHLRRLLGQTG